MLVFYVHESSYKCILPGTLSRGRRSFAFGSDARRLCGVCGEHLGALRGEIELGNGHQAHLRRGPRQRTTFSTQHLSLKKSRSKFSPNSPMSVFIKKMNAFLLKIQATRGDKHVPLQGVVLVHHTSSNRSCCLF